jgi:hypothetical protein
MKDYRHRTKTSVNPWSWSTNVGFLTKRSSSSVIRRELICSIQDAVDAHGKSLAVVR